MKKYNLAVVGATGLVGSTFLKVLAEYDFPINQLHLFASSRSVGKIISYRGKDYVIEELNENCFNGIDIALFSAGGSVSMQYAPIAEKSGAIVVDNSSAWRMEKGVPLIIPEINIDDYTGQRKIIANPNCSTIQSVLPLKVLFDKFGLERVVFTTFQAVSGSGQKGIEDLDRTKKGEKPQFYPYDISNTCIPQIDAFCDNGYTKEEMKMVNETRKILHDENLPISATCVRVPVKNSHAVSIMAQLSKKFEIKEIFDAFNDYPGITLYDDVSKLVYPISTIATGNDNVYVGRIRKDLSNENSVLFYTVSDNVRKGAASNAVQIAYKLASLGKI